MSTDFFFLTGALAQGKDPLMKTWHQHLACSLSINLLPHALPTNALDVGQAYGLVLRREVQVGAAPVISLVERNFLAINRRFTRPNACPAHTPNGAIAFAVFERDAR